MFIGYCDDRSDETYKFICLRTRKVLMSRDVICLGKYYKEAEKFGYGLDYKFPHDYPGNYVDQEYLPKELHGKIYVPKDKKKKED